MHFILFPTAPTMVHAFRNGTGHAALDMYSHFLYVESVEGRGMCASPPWKRDPEGMEYSPSHEAGQERLFVLGAKGRGQGVGARSGGRKQGRIGAGAGKREGRESAFAEGVAEVQGRRHHREIRR